jgi:hypothetical protein
MAERVQTYKNHLRWLPPFHFFVLPVLFLNFLNELRHLWRFPSEGAAFIAVVAAALATLAFLARSQAVAVQDRVIRLEMRLRLRQVLPPELQPRIHDLSARQLVALRFASDAELPELVREILDGKLQTGRQIKQRVKHWQPDWLRA